MMTVAFVAAVFVGAACIRILWMRTVTMGRRLDILENDTRVCRHTSVTNQGTFGAPEWICDDCGAVVPE